MTRAGTGFVAGARSAARAPPAASVEPNRLGGDIAGTGGRLGEHAIHRA
ncbi:hypothetical protein [Frankia sp. R82]|nr:hypothetical protein [Frankia sp. R82]MCM3887285.1 hypothetical protein [Frankia sp. R82]